MPDCLPLRWSTERKTSGRKCSSSPLAASTIRLVMAGDTLNANTVPRTLFTFPLSFTCGLSRLGEEVICLSTKFFVVLSKFRLRPTTSCKLQIPGSCTLLSIALGWGKVLGVFKPLYLTGYIRSVSKPLRSLDRNANLLPDNHFTDDILCFNKESQSTSTAYYLC